MRNIAENNELTQRRNRNPSPKVFSRKHWCPPKLDFQKTVCENGVAESLKECKVMLEKMNSITSSQDSSYYKNILDDGKHGEAASEVQDS